MHGFSAAAPGWLAHLRSERSTAALRPAIASLTDMNRITGAADLIEQGKGYD
jgi:hypothetical protein